MTDVLVNICVIVFLKYTHIFLQIVFDIFTYIVYFHSIEIRIGGVMVSVPAISSVDHGFEAGRIKPRL